MRFKLYTTVDVTETNARRQEDRKLYSQQTNYNTLLQTIGLRVNLIPISVISHVDTVDKIGFGSNISGKHRYWEFIFEIEYEGALNLQMMIDDFDLIPIITELDETVHNHNKIFRTTCPKERNIVFKIIG